MRKPFFIPEDFSKFNYLCDSNYCGLGGADHVTPYHNPPCHMIECAEIANQKVQTLFEEIVSLKAFISEMNEPFNWDE